jgi:hypothetical protein
MKYIITESQYKTIVESNKRIDAFQELINNELNRIKDMCDDDDGTNDYDICDEVSSIEQIVVNDVETFSAYKISYITIKVDVMYHFFKYKDYDEVIYELKRSIEKSTGLPIKLEYESHNLKSDFQW